MQASRYCPIVLVVTLAACDRGRKVEPATRTSETTKSTPVEPAPKVKPRIDKPTPWSEQVDRSTWPAEVTRRVDELRRLTARPEVAGRVVRLAKQGPGARQALWSLTSDPSLPEPQRAVSGIVYAQFYRFDLPSLKALVQSPNPFVARSAAQQLGHHGGEEARRFLLSTADSASSPGFARHLRKAARHARARALPKRANKLLHRLLNEQGKATKKQVAAMFSVDYIEQGQGEEDLLQLIESPCSDSDSRMFGSFALCRGSKDNLDRLKKYAGRSNDKLLRYAALKELAEHAAGKAFLQQLLAAPGEPMRDRIKKMLGK